MITLDKGSGVRGQGSGVGFQVERITMPHSGLKPETLHLPPATLSYAKITYWRRNASTAV